MRLTDLGNGTGKYSSCKGKESSIVNNIVKALSARGGFVRKIHGGGYQRAGFPDVMYIENGVPFFFEVKKPGGDTTALQKRNLTLLDKAGACVGVVTSEKEALDCVEKAFKKRVKVITFNQGGNSIEG